MQFGRGGVAPHPHVRADLGTDAHQMSLELVAHGQAVIAEGRRWSNWLRHGFYWEGRLGKLTQEAIDHHCPILFDALRSFAFNFIAELLHPDSAGEGYRANASRTPAMAQRRGIWAPSKSA